MTTKKRPGAHCSDRARECVLAGTPPDTTPRCNPQQSATACRVIGWRVSASLIVDAVEVRT